MNRKEHKAWKIIPVNNKAVATPGNRLNYAPVLPFVFSAFFAAKILLTVA